MTTGLDIVKIAARLIGPHTRYRLGSEVSLTQRNFDVEAINTLDPLTFVDCSEFTQTVGWCGGVPLVDGVWQQVAQLQQIGGLKIDFARFVTTAGSLGYRNFGPRGAGGMGNHVLISRGDGTSWEARSTKAGCGSFSVYGRGLNGFFLWPGVDYTTPVPPLPAPTELKPMYDPPLPVAAVDTKRGSDGSVLTAGVAPDGSVFLWPVQPLPLPPGARIGANGLPAFTGRRAVGIEVLHVGGQYPWQWTVIAQTGERYTFPYSG